MEDFIVRVIRTGTAVREEFPIHFSSHTSVGSPTSKTTKKRNATGELAHTLAIDKRPHLEAGVDDILFKDSWVGKSEETRKGRAFLIPVSISWVHLGQLRNLSFEALLDTGADVSVFDIDFVERQLLPWTRRERPLRMRGIDGSLCKRSGKVQVKGLQLEITDSGTKRSRNTAFTAEAMTFGDRKVNHFPLILGMDWIQTHIHKIDIRARGVEFAEQIDLVEVHTHENWDNAVEEARYIGMINCERVNYAHDMHHKTSQADAMDWATKRIRTVSAGSQWTDASGEAVELRLPVQYRPFAEVFSREAQQSLPAHGPHDMEINLEPGKVPPAGSLYPLSKDELDLLKDYLEEMTRTGKIRPSSGAAGAPIFFAKQASGKLRIVVDYRGLNAVTVKDKYPLPLMTQLMEQFSESAWFTKLDLKNGFNLIRIAAGDEWKTAFRTRYGAFEYLVMPFGLTNAPSVFQRYMHGLLGEKLDRGIVVYIDDILIYTKTEEEHTELVKWVLQKIKDAGLCVNIDKCQFHVREVEFVGFSIGKGGVSMCTDKVEQILDWAPPRNVVETQRFLGFANFYRRFIKGYSTITLPITQLTSPRTPWNWNEQCQNAFERLKKAFTEAPILAHFAPERAKMVETDASDLAKGAILSQLEPDNRWHPIAYLSERFTPAELNYDVHDKEMVVIVQCFKRWRHFLIGCPQKIQVFTDHKNLEYFNSTKILNRRQARWSEILSEFDFVITYRPGEKNGKADALSRRTDPELEGGGKATHQVLDMFKPGQLQMEGRYDLLEARTVRIAALNVEENRWAKQIMDAGLQDKTWNELRIALETGTAQNEKGDYMLEDGLVCFKRRIWIPDDNALKVQVAMECHDSKVAGHFGRDKTLELMKRNYYWPRMEDWVREYVKTCTTCQRTKTQRHAKYGRLKPLDIPYIPWTHISMDFITDLPEVTGYSKIWVIVDRFSKMAHFIPLKKTTAPQLAMAFVKEIWRLHGLPTSIVSDRDPLFTSKFWTALMKLLDVNADKSTAFHPQTDGGTEVLNQTIEAYLRAFINWEMTNWVELLPFAEFCYNNSEHSATKTTPFYGVYGKHPTNNWPVPVIVNNPAAEDVVQNLEQLQTIMRENLKQAQTRMAKYYDRKVHPKAPDFKVGDWVMLRADHIKTQRKSKKLDYKMRGKFRIKRCISTHAFELELPPGSGKIHPVFHIGLLEPFHENTIPGRTEETPPPVDIEENRYEIEAIRDSKLVRKEVKYLVAWKGYGPDENTWEPYENIVDGGEEMLKQFHLLQPGKPRDLRVEY